MCVLRGVGTWSGKGSQGRHRRRDTRLRKHHVPENTRREQEPDTRVNRLHARATKESERRAKKSRESAVCMQKSSGGRKRVCLPARHSTSRSVGEAATTTATKTRETKKKVRRRSIDVQPVSSERVCTLLSAGYFVSKRRRAKNGQHRSACVSKMTSTKKKSKLERRNEQSEVEDGEDGEDAEAEVLPPVAIRG